MGLFRNKRSGDDDEAVLAEELAAVEDVLRRYPPGSQLNFGSPSRCPECGDFGMVRHVSHDLGVCSNSCLSCRRDWIVTIRALKAHRSQQRDQRKVAVEGGVLLAAPALPVAPPDPPTPAAILAPEPPEPAQSTPDSVVEPEPPSEPGPEHPPEPLEPPIELVDSARLSSASSPQTHDAALRVLVVEDNPFDFAVIEELAGDAGPIELVHVLTLREAIVAVRSSSFDLVLLDLDLPDSAGLTTILEWQHGPVVSLPLVALTDDADPELISGARALGAVHVIQKEHLEQLTDTQKGHKKFLGLVDAAVASHRRECVT